MTVEKAALISELVSTYPRNVDLINEGDDHIRLVKAVLKNNFPNFNSIMTMSSDKLNNLDKTFSATDKDGNVTINGAVTMAANKTINAGANRIQNMSNPTAAQDAVTLAYLQSGAARLLAWPVGSIFLSINATNPRDLLGGGTWVRVAIGRMLVGQGAANDDRGRGRNHNFRDNGGVWEGQLGVNHLPNHRHFFNENTNVAGSHTHSMSTKQDRMSIHDVRGNWFRGTDGNKNWTDPAGEHAHNVQGWTRQTEGANAAFFPVTAPSFGVSVWERTA